MINLVKRNLEQQVLKNQEDIEALKQLGMPGVKVTAVANTIEDITEPIVGAFYLVKKNELNGYNLYIYTADEEFFDLGEFPKQGPQGIQGTQGPKGETGESTRWYSGAAFPLTAKNGDMFLDVSSYQVYMYNGSQWIPQTNIKGAAGRDGLNGNSITFIDHQHQGTETVVTINTSKGSPTIFSIPDGTPGAGFHIAHIYPDDVAGAPTLSTLPDGIEYTIEEEWPAATSDPSEAVLVKTTQDGDFIFVIIVDNKVNKWDNVGQIQSVQGPQGEPGTQIMDSQDITKTAEGAQYPNTYKLNINSIPYSTSAPVADYTPSEPGFKIVVLYQSQEASTTKYDGYLYIFIEDPPTP